MTDQFKVFNSSFERCIVDPLFLERFYEIFLSSSDEIREKFKNTDMEKQKGILLTSLAYIMYADKNPDPLFKTAQNHDHEHLDIKPQMYSLWLDSMLQAVKLTDPKYNDNIEPAWRESLQPGINYMIKNY